MHKKLFNLVHAEARRRACDAIQSAPDGYSVLISEPTRTTSQNAAQWPILDAFAAQLKWPVNGELVYMANEEWKDVLTAAFRKERVRLAAELDGGGVVMLGLRTGGFGVKEFSDWLEFLNATAAARGVEL